MKELKVGDVVRLKSGGVKMTVEDIDTSAPKHYATCVWFDGPAFKSQNILLGALEIYDPPKTRSSFISR